MRYDVEKEIEKYRGDFKLINKSELARRLDCDRRTIDRYLLNKGTIRKSRTIEKLINGYEEIIKEKLDIGATIMAVYKFIKNEKGYQGGYQTVYNFAKKYKDSSLLKATIRFETNPGLQAQVDWKEKLTMVSKHGELFEVNIFLMVLGYSRMKYMKLTTSRTQNILFLSMIEGFKYFGGIPKEILFDNMSTVVDRSKTTYKNISINKRFDQFSKDAGFKIITCRPYRPQTKGKVEALAKLTSRLKPYNGEFETFEELECIVKEMNNKLNAEISQATSETAFARLDKEKEYLLPISTTDYLSSYFLHEKEFKVSKESMITYKGKKYSVPISYISSHVTVKESDTEICIYYTGDLIACHTKKDKPFNYIESHVKEILKSDAFSHFNNEMLDNYIETNLKQMDLFLDMEA